MHIHIQTNTKTLGLIFMQMLVTVNLDIPLKMVLKYSNRSQYQHNYAISILSKMEFVETLELLL